MAESREAVDAEPDADAETSAAESEVLGTEEVSSDAAQPATSQQQPTTQHLPSNSRAMRNLMEKNRRDKLNAYISELAREVPMVACSPKRMDKTSILRLTSVFLRLHQFLSGESGGLSLRLGLPSSYLEGFDLNQLLQVMDGFMLIVTSTGKIVFVSHTVETLLGYAQADLLGQRLHDYTCPEDRSTLDEKLTPDPDPGAPSDLDSSVGQMSVGEDSSSSGETTSSSSGGSQSSPSPQQQLTVCSSSPSSSSAPGVTLDRQRRSFFLRLRQRAVSRSEITQYELVHILGDLRVPRRPAPGSSTTPSGRHSNRSSRQQRDASGSSSNSRDDIVLVAVVRLVRESSVAERSLLEHSKDEYVTRHLLDGRIIYSDHRISVVAGYMAEEVAGESAFKFMHVEDMHFTITALRQMYDRGKESYGSSCYRLQSKTGQYIYLRTHGYLEYDKDTQQIVSFICINTLVSDEEGEALVRDMKMRYSATVATRHPQPEMHRAIAGPASSHTAAAPDPEELQVAISCLMSNFPMPNPGDKAEEGTETAPPDTQYEKAVLYSKALPPAKVQAQKIGLMPLLPSPRPEPQSPTGPLSVTIPETPPARAQSEPGWPTMKRESVITTCRTAERQQSVVVTTRDYEASRSRATPVVKRTISVLENDTQSGSKRHAGYAQRRRERRATEPTPQTQEEMEEPRRTPEEQLNLIMSRSPHTTALMHCVVSPGEIRSPAGGPNSPLMYTKPPSVNVMGTPSPGGGPQSSPTCSNNSMHEFGLPFIMAGVGHTSPLDSISPPQFMPMDPGETLTESLAPFDMLGAVPFAELDTIPTESFLEELPEQIPNATDQMEQRLAQTHHDLHSNLQLQEQDISQLEQNIQHHSLASQVYGPEIDQIRAQRKKQEQELMSLQQDHLNIHRGSSSRTSATFTTAAAAAKSCQRVG